MLRPASASVLFVRVSIVFSSPGLELDKSASDAFVSSSVHCRAPSVLRLVSAEALITISRPARCVHFVFISFHPVAFGRRRFTPEQAGADVVVKAVKKLKRSRTSDLSLVDGRDLRSLTARPVLRHYKRDVG